LSLAFFSSALLLGCAQLLGLKDDVLAGPCQVDADCAPHQACVAETCHPEGESGGSGGSKPTSGGAAAAGGQLNEAGQASGGSESSGAGESNAGAPSGGGTETGGGTGNLPECQRPDDCVGTDNECAKRTCTQGVCGVEYEKMGVVPSTQTAGDCQKLVCDGKGAVKSQADDSDLPDDGNPCRLDTCTGGVPTHDPAPSTTSCGTTGQFKCDGKGVCGGCTKASDCGLDNLCATYSCTANVCKTTFVSSGQGNLANTAGDCKKNVCDGMGNPVAIADGSDLPNDNDPCTKDVCTAGAPSHPFESATKSCGPYSTCNGAGSCICSDPAAAACSRAGAQCGGITNGCGQPVSCPDNCNDGINTCNGAGNPNACGCTPKTVYCGGLQCGGSVSDGCGHVTDCTADCQYLCPDNCSTKSCLGTGCYCADCNG
jgi:hypothetical protein